VGVAPAEIRGPRGIRLSKRVLAFASDERLVAEVRRGNDSAFEVVYERHSRPVLSFCRHMLGSREEGEEALQHTFLAAWSDLQRNERPINLRPWLYAIARNRCLSLLRGRHPEPAELHEQPSTAGLAEEVSRRADLRALLGDLRELPEEQRAALVLSELGGFSHADIAEVIERDEADVKAVVFRARQKLADWRAARETPCEEIREQIASLTGNALRRRSLRRHLETCPGCRGFRDEVRAQRGMLAVILPVAPTLGLKPGVLAAIGLGGGGTAGVLGAATVAKVAAVAVTVGAATAGGERLLDREQGRAVPEVTPRSSPVHSPAAPLPTPGNSGRGAREAEAPKVNRDVRERGRSQSRRQQSGGGASNLAPPDTPVRARGNPPALGRLKQGKPPPPAGSKGHSGGSTKVKEHGPAKLAPPKLPKAKEPKPQSPGRAGRPPAGRRPPPASASSRSPA
jgi:RNA polymerase sigma factor (sigma-70 family)